jgi:hypothetical protein
MGESQLSEAVFLNCFSKISTGIQSSEKEKKEEATSKEMMALHKPSITALFIALLYFQTYKMYRQQRAIIRVR